MTLVEILVALSVSTLVLAIALSIYYTFSSSFRDAGNPLSRQATLAVDTLRHDLASCLQLSFSNNPTFELESEPSGLDGRFRSTLVFHVALSPPGDQGVPRMTIQRLAYSLQENPSNPADSALVRESVTVWGPDAMAAPVSNAALVGVSHFEVSVLDQKGWTNRWKSTRTSIIPRAARISFDWQTPRTNESVAIVVFIPAGNGIPAPAGKRRPVTGKTTPSPGDTAAPTPEPPRATGNKDQRGRP
jgi:type II secretory pathway component PulJ